MRSMRYSSTSSFIGAGLGLSIIVGIVLLIVGWFNNINYVVDSDFSDVSGREIVSIIGIPMVPIGMVNGAIYIFEDEKDGQKEDESQISKED